MTEDRQTDLLRQINQKMMVALALLFCILVATCANQFTFKEVTYEDETAEIDLLPPSPSPSPAQKG